MVNSSEIKIQGLLCNSQALKLALDANTNATKFVFASVEQGILKTAEIIKEELRAA